jgi:hypothetical protein
MNTLNNTDTTFSHKPIRLARVLTYLGVLPFLFAVFISISPHMNLPDFLGGEIAYAGFKAKALLHSYAVVILSFLAGIQWGVCLHDNKQTKLILISNVLAIMAWLSLMAFASKFALSILLFGFIIALIADSKAYKNQLIPKWFWHLRMKVSVIVCLALLIVIFVT